MKKKRFSVEQMVGVLKQAQVGVPVAEVIRKAGIVRFEVLGLDADRDQIRSFAKRLAQNDAEANQIRSQVRQTVSDIPQKKGGILAALRRSPLVGLELEIDRPFDAGREVDL